MNDWNDDQLLAIKTTDKGVVVSAAAGSGKTTVLVERTIRMLSDPVNRIPADRLLAVTFTVEAAGQLRRKLSAALEQKLKAETDPDVKSWLREQHEKLSLAKISTINAFCYDLVKSNLHRTNFRDGVKIIDENDAEVLVNESFDDALSIFAEKQREDYDLLYDTLTDGDAEKIKENGIMLMKFLRSLPFPDSWLKDAIDDLNSEKQQEGWLEAVQYDLRDGIDRVERLCDKCVRTIAELNDTVPYPQVRVDMILDEQEFFEDCRRLIEKLEWDKISPIAERTFGKFSRLKKDIATPEDPADVEKWDLIKDTRTAYRDIFKKKLADKIMEIGADIKGPLALSARMIRALADYCAIAEELITKEKERRNVLEFSDVERMAIKMLITKDEDGKLSRTELCCEFRENHDHLVVLIDEFQDVNNLQDTIFKALSDTDDLSVLGRNVFVVGDIKQSIYRFRQSNPALFSDAKKAAASPDRREDLTLVELKTNYRSRENIIDLVNMLFSRLMGEEIGEVEYVGGERLQAGAKYKGKDPAVEVLFIDTVSDDETENDEDDDNETISESDENYAIARRIKELVDEQALVTGDDGELRPCRPSDFCVLYRSSRSVETLEAAFDTYGLKVAADKGLGYLRSREISIMTDLLRVIDNPMKDIPMAAIMLSPLLGFTPDELALIRKYCTKPGSLPLHLYQAILDICGDTKRKPEDERLTAPHLTAKCRAAKELVARLGFYSSGMTVTRLIRRIYDETEILAVASSFEDSIQKRANLRMLLKYAESYSEGGDGSVYGFIRYLESVSDNDKDLAQAMTIVDTSDSVSVKTIHASKGLEFPFVVMCGLDRSFNTRDLSRSMLLDERLGVGFSILDHEKMTKTKTIAYAAVKAVALNKTLSEEMRLLYVSLTRAKERILIPLIIKYNSKGECRTAARLAKIAADISDNGCITPALLRANPRFSDWICAALLCSEYKNVLTERFSISTELPTLEDSADIVFMEKPLGEKNTAGETDYYSGSADEKLVEKLVTGFLHYDNFDSKTAASKLTVTEITSDLMLKKLGKNNPLFFPSLPKLSEELSRLSAAKKGTYTHLFMELADYGNCEKDVKAELDRLVKNGSFTEKQAEGVYIGAVKKFFSGDFYNRLKSSEHILREKKFLVKADELGLSGKYSEYLSDGSMLQGVADCIFLEDDGYVLVDYKTDNFKDISEVSEYSSQLELYKAALDLILDKPVKACYIYSFKLNEGVEISL